MNTLTYTIHLEADEEGGYIVTVPALPGCVTDGDTLPEAIAHAEECVRGFVKALMKAGQPIPPGDSEIHSVDVPVRIELPVAV